MIESSAIALAGKRRESGYSLIELMVSITLGLLILAGLSEVFLNSSRSLREIDRSSQQVENGRYAEQILADDLHNAGFLAEFNPIDMSTPAALPDACATDLPTLKTALPLAIQGINNVAVATTPSCLSDVKIGSDVLVVRRASTCVVGTTGCDALVTGAPYFIASACSSGTELASNSIDTRYALVAGTPTATLHKYNCTTLAEYHQYRTHIYFVANNDKAGDGIPTLKRAELGAGAFTIVPLVEGIDNLQLEYGVDLAGTGSPSDFTTGPAAYNSCSTSTSPTCVGNWRNVVAAKVFVLARNTTVTPGYTDSKSYALGSSSVAPGGSYGRHVYQSTVKLNNTAGRNTP